MSWPKKKHLIPGALVGETNLHMGWNMADAIWHEQFANLNMVHGPMEIIMIYLLQMVMSMAMLLGSKGYMNYKPRGTPRIFLPRPFQTVVFLTRNVSLAPRGCIERTVNRTSGWTHGETYKNNKKNVLSGLKLGYSPIFRHIDLGRGKSKISSKKVKNL